MTLALAVTEYGSGPPLGILHGLFGSGRNWTTIGRKLAGGHRVLAIDLRNHGASPWADSMSYEAMAEDVRAVMQARGHHRFALLGHSMGGKVAMLLALSHPAEVERLVVVDIAPVVYPPRHLAYVRAMRALDLGAIGRRAEADRRLIPAIPDAAERGFLMQNLLFEEGRARWRLNLAAIEAEMLRLGAFPAPAGAAMYCGPALFLAGARSDYLLPEHEPAIRRLFPRARIARLENAGHWLHAEQPAAFLAAVGAFVGERS